MKQFQYTKPSGGTYGPYSTSEAEHLIVLDLGLMWLHDSDVGTTFTDTDGDTWTRLPDLVPSDVPVPVVYDPAEAGRQNLQRAEHTERLERIALAYLAVLGPAYFANTFLLKTGFSLARACADNARELIAELDKPEGNPFEAGL